METTTQKEIRLLCQTPKQLEMHYVKNVYDKLATHFDCPKNKAWPKVKHFLESMPPGALIADVGCGGGKYFKACNKETFLLGCDICKELLASAQKSVKHPALCVADNQHLPYRSNVFDAAISVAVIHHFSTEKRRMKALEELVRIIRPGGKLLIYVWALEQRQRRFSAQDVFIPMKNCQLKHPLSADSVDKIDATENDATIIKANKKSKRSTTSNRCTSASPMLSRIRGFWASNVPANEVVPEVPKPGNERKTSESINMKKTSAARREWANSATSRTSLDVMSFHLNRWSPRMGRKISNFLGYDPMDYYAAEFMENLMKTAMDDFIMIKIIAPKLKEERQKKQSQEETGANLMNQKNDQVFTSVEEAAINPLSLRYYHVFKKGELESLISNIPNLTLLSAFYDNANWGVIVRKNSISKNG